MKMLSGIIKSKRIYLELVAVALVSLLPRLFGIQRFLWKDELISLRTFDVNIFQNTLLFGATTNLPFFFYILKFFHLIFSPDTLWAYRALPIIFGVATILAMFLFLSKALNKKIAWFAVIIMSISPLQVYYSQELRPYSLIQLLLVLNIGFLYLYLQDKQLSNFVFFTLTTVLIVFTHYTGYYFLLSEGLLLAVFVLISFIKKKPVNKSILNLLGVLFFSGLLGLVLLYFMSKNPLFLKSISLLEVGGHWNPLGNIFGEIFLFFTRLKEVLTYYYWFGLYYYSVDPIVQFIFKKFIALLIALVFYFVYINRKSKEALVILSISFVLFVALKFSYLGEKLGYFPFGGRHVMPYSVFLYVLIAYALSKLKAFGMVLLFLLALVLASYQFCFLYKIPADKVFITIPNEIYKTCVTRIF